MNPESNSNTGQRAGAAPRFCPYCGNSLTGSFRFCPHCGKPLPELSPQASPHTRPAPSPSQRPQPPQPAASSQAFRGAGVGGARQGILSVRTGKVCFTLYFSAAVFLMLLYSLCWGSGNYDMVNPLFILGDDFFYGWGGDEVYHLVYLPLVSIALFGMAWCLASRAQKPAIRWTALGMGGVSIASSLLLAALLFLLKALEWYPSELIFLLLCLLVVSNELGMAGAFVMAQVGQPRPIRIAAWSLVAWIILCLPIYFTILSDSSFDSTNNLRATAQILLGLKVITVVFLYFAARRRRVVE